MLFIQLNSNHHNGWRSARDLAPAGFPVPPTHFRDDFMFPAVHGIFISDPPPRHPPIVAVEGFPMPGPCLRVPGPGRAADAEPSSGCVRHSLTQPPSAAKAIP